MNEAAIPLQTSESLDQLAAALAASQSKFPAIAKDKTAEIPTKSGTKYKFQYADLADVLAAVRPALSENGLAITQLVHGKALLTALLHSSGQRIVSSVDLMQVQADPKVFGAEITYLRRYALCALLGIAADDDVDAPQTDARADDEPQKVRAPAARSARTEGKAEAADSGELATDGERAFLKKRAGDGLDDLLKRIGASSLEALTAEQFKAARSDLVRAA